MATKILNEMEKGGGRKPRTLQDIIPVVSWDAIGCYNLPAQNRITTGFRMVLDASSAEYVRILKKVGWTEIIAQRKEVVISKPITVLMTSITPAHWHRQAALQRVDDERI